jgi:hypothetical protein
MEPYFFQGVVLPERAQISLAFNAKFSHVSSGTYAEAKVSVVLNQVAVWVICDDEWNIFELRSVVRNLVQGHLVMLGYIFGYAYDLEISRVLSPERQIDYVFGIDIPFLTARAEGKDINEELLKLRKKTVGEQGLLITRCFNDLTFAIKYVEDTGFYCYRAIESLRHHCANSKGLKDAGKTIQWSALREFSGVDEASLRAVKEAADALRHGEASGNSTMHRDELLKLTWQIVDSYITKI